MKIQKNLLVIIILFILMATFIVGSLRSYGQTAPVIEKKIGNTVYELDTAIYVLKNKANKIARSEYNSGGCIVSFDNEAQAQKDWLENFKPVFSKERAKESKMRINISCVFDSTGLIREIEILFWDRKDFEMFSLSEIKAIEDAAKKYRYKNLSWNNCRDAKYGRFVHPLVPYLLYYEKPK